MRSKFLALITSLIFIAFALPATSKPVNVWIYHNFAPFVIDATHKHGLSYDLAQWLTENSNGIYEFNVTVHSRARLNETLSGNPSGIVFWVNPAWFGDVEENKYFWTKPLMRDRTLIISPLRASIDYKGPASLEGMTITSVSGHRYVGIDPLVEEGRMSRNDLSSEEAVTLFISNERGDVGVIAESALLSLTQQLNLHGKIFSAKEPHSIYDRRVMITRDDPDLIEFMQKSLSDMKRDGHWSELLNKYGLSEN